MSTAYTTPVATQSKAAVRSLANIPLRTGGAVREAVTLAFDAIWRNKLRSALTMLGIVIAVTTVIIISSVINGLNSNVVSAVEDIGSNVIICYRFPWASTGRPPTEWFQRKELEAEWAEEIAQLPGVEAGIEGLMGEEWSRFATATSPAPGRFYQGRPSAMTRWRTVSAASPDGIRCSARRRCAGTG